MNTQQKGPVTLQIYLAPMEGITGYIVRNAFAHNFAGIDKYFTPFIPAAKRLNYKIERDLDPENNKGIRLVPQLISNDADETLEMIKLLKNYGYNEFNINLGCPSGTVASKKRGSGLLLYPGELERYLDSLYEKADVPISLKTRIGYNSLEEWPVLLKIFSRYPASELIIHPRLKKELYSGFPHLKAFADAYNLHSLDICYNGDIWNLENYHSLTADFPALDKIMIGRGLLAKPFLAELIKDLSISGPGSSPAPDSLMAPENIQKNKDAAINRVRDFCNEIYHGYLSIFKSEKDAAMHMKEIWGCLSRSFKDSSRLTKELIKCTSAAQYRALTDQIFNTLELIYP